VRQALGGGEGRHDRFGNLFPEIGLRFLYGLLLCRCQMQPEAQGEALPELQLLAVLDAMLQSPVAPGAPGTALPLQPQCGDATAIVKAMLGGKVLHVRLPGARDRDGVQVYIVLLLRDIALNVEDELLARL
jgi:hypothetical protein